MPEVLSMSHYGVPCAIPPAHVLDAKAPGSSEGFVSFWPKGARHESAPGERALRVATGAGPRWIRCAHARLVWISHLMIWRIPPLLQEVMSAHHVVGLTEIDGELSWLVDVQRFFPDLSDE